MGGQTCDRDCDLETDYRARDTNGLMEAAQHRSWEMRRHDDGPEIDFLCVGPPVTGPVVHPTEDCKMPSGAIAILPDASPRWGLVAQTTAAIIVEHGGALAHVVQVNRERGVSIVRVPGARKLWPEGTTLIVADGTVRIQEVSHAG